MNINKQILCGRVGQEPKISVTPSGQKVAHFSIATNNRKGETYWHEVTVFGKLAEIVENYVHKGKEVYVEGETQHRKYEKDGQTHIATEVIVSELVLGSNAEEAAPSNAAAPARVIERADAAAPRKAETKVEADPLPF